MRHANHQLLLPHLDKVDSNFVVDSEISNQQWLKGQENLRIGVGSNNDLICKLSNILP